MTFLTKLSHRSRPYTQTFKRFFCDLYLPTGKDVSKTVTGEEVSEVLIPFTSSYDNKDDKQHIDVVFLDTECLRPGRKVNRCMLEFASISLHGRTFQEIHRYSTLIRPRDEALTDLINLSNGINSKVLRNARYFSDVADEIFKILDGKIWAGHNIRAFDWPQIKYAFDQIGRPAPSYAEIVDSLPAMRNIASTLSFVDCRLSTLAEHFGLEKQIHRALPDVILNINVFILATFAFNLAPIKRGKKIAADVQTQDKGNRSLVSNQRSQDQKSQDQKSLSPKERKAQLSRESSRRHREKIKGIYENLETENKRLTSELEEVGATLEKKRAQLEEERAVLEKKRAQLEEVRAALEKKQAQLEEPLAEKKQLQTRSK